jgi:hypothetical protein
MIRDAGHGGAGPSTTSKPAATGRPRDDCTGPIGVIGYCTGREAQQFLTGGLRENLSNGPINRRYETTS